MFFEFFLKAGRVNKGRIIHAIEFQELLLIVVGNAADRALGKKNANLFSIIRFAKVKKERL